MTKQPYVKRWRKPLEIKTALPALTLEILQKRGIHDPALLLNWKTIIGDKLANLCTIDKITYVGQNRNTGTLYIRCKPQYALDILHQQSYLLDKVNVFFGYKALHHVKIIQVTS
jgi:hypothetical protein